MNVFKQLQAMLPQPPVLVGIVREIHDDDTSTVEIPGNLPLAGYGDGTTVTGSLIRPRGSHVPVGKRAFVRAGVIETRAPDTEAEDIGVGTVVITVTTPEEITVYVLDTFTGAMQPIVTHPGLSLTGHTGEIGTPWFYTNADDSLVLGKVKDGVLRRPTVNEETADGTGQTSAAGTMRIRPTAQPPSSNFVTEVDFTLDPTTGTFNNIQIELAGGGDADFYNDDISTLYIYDTGSELYLGSNGYGIDGVLLTDGSLNTLRLEYSTNYYLAKLNGTTIAGWVPDDAFSAWMWLTLYDQNSTDNSKTQCTISRFTIFDLEDPTPAPTVLFLDTFAGSSGSVSGHTSDSGHTYSMSGGGYGSYTIANLLVNGFGALATASNNWGAAQVEGLTLPPYFVMTLQLNIAAMSSGGSSFADLQFRIGDSYDYRIELRKNAGANEINFSLPNGGSGWIAYSTGANTVRLERTASGEQWFFNSVDVTGVCSLDTFTSTSFRIFQSKTDHTGAFDILRMEITS